MRKVFLENLPKWIDGRNKGSIDWCNTCGYKVRFIYDDVEGHIEIIKYNSKTRKLIVLYNNNEFTIQAMNFFHGKLGNILNKFTSNFKIRIEHSFKDDKRDITIIDREYRFEDFVDEKCKNNLTTKKSKYYKYHCNMCGYEGWSIESSILGKQASGCACCSGRIVIKGINDISTTHPHLVKYFKNIEDTYTHTYASNDKVLMECPDCGAEKEMIINNLAKRGYSCPICSDKISYGEKFLNSILSQLDLNFKTQLTKTTFKWCKNYRYDFYFEYNNEQYICEVNGIQHYEETKRKNARTLTEEQENDILKKELALKNNIKEKNYIVIDCRKSTLEWIKQNISASNLSNIFDFSNIDWIKAEEFASNNLMKLICEMKNNNPNMSTTEIGEVLKLGKQCVRAYLKRGAILNWCSYNANIESSKNGFNNGRSNAKTVEIFKDNISLGIFESCIYLENNSERLFGIKLKNKNISAVCLGNQKSHKGFTFQYV